MNQMIIPHEEQAKLLSKKNEIPPIELRQHLSPDGQELWDTTNFEYYHFHAELKAYFQGLPSQLQSLSEEWRCYLEVKRKWFLALYELIRQSWQYLTPYHQDKNGNELTPGLLAAEILEAECRGSLLPAVAARVEIAPRFNYDLPAKIAKARHKGKRSIDQLNYECRKKWGEQYGDYSLYKVAATQVGILSWCRYAASQDKYAKNALKAYELAATDLQSTLHKHWNYRKRKQEIWENGNKKLS
ncbi:MAG: hypothetical protein ACYTXA_16315 [Nostoc sp.]